MASLDFPSNPTNGQTYALNGVTYYYNSSMGAWLTQLTSMNIASSSNTQVLFNDGGIANTHSGATYNRTTGLMSITANLQSGNLISTGIMFATSSANVASLISRGDANVTGNVNGGNIVGGYGNAQVAAYLQVYNGNITA